MKKPTIIIIIIITLVYLQISSKPSHAIVPPDPQYLIFNKTSTGGSPEQTCCFWYSQDPSSITKEAINEIKSTIQSNGTNNRLPGVSFYIPYLDTTNSQEENTLQKLFDLAESENFPILIKLDGLNWWESRSDLWNWWDPNLPGYNPNNKQNVEWIDWHQNSAIKISWRNWGKQIRVRPHPNLASQQYLDEKLKQLNRLLPQIKSWYDSLPFDKKYLFAGVISDAEISIGVNYFYYPNGNSYLDLDEANDPTYGLDFSKGPNGGLIQLGFAAVKGFGIKDTGNLTIVDLNQAVNKHAEILAKVALDSGIPFDKIFIHGGGNFAINPSQTFSYSNVITDYAKPAWSFYDISEDISLAPGLSQSLNALDDTPWGAAEFYYLGENTTANWQQALLNAFKFDNNKLVTIQNWESISTNQQALQAIENVLNQPPTCWLSPPTINTVISANSVNFTWETPENASALYLNVSDSKERIPSGSIKHIDIINENVTGKTSFTRALSPGTYYWQIVADGCNPVQRRIAYSSFTLPANIPGDTDNDGDVDIFDYNTLVSNFGATDCGNAADTDSDCDVDIFDYNLLVSNFGIQY